MSRILGWLLILVTLVSTWRIFVKAGRPGWQAIVPVYNVFITFRIADLPMWQAGALVALVVARFAVGMAVLPFIFYPILAFGSARYGEPEPRETLGLSGA